MQNFLHRQRHMETVSKLIPSRIFGMPMSSMFSLIDQNSYILRPTRTCSFSAISGVPKILSFLKVCMSCFWFFPPVSEIFSDICGRLRGEGIVKASLKGTYCASGSCKQLPVSTVPKASADHHRLRPIITQGYPMLWECLIDCSVGFGLCICTRQTVCYCITYKSAYANVNLNIAIGSLTTNI